MQPIRRHSDLSNREALLLDHSGGTLARPMRRKDVPTIPLKQVKLLYFWLVSKQKAVSANGSASRVCLHTCLDRRETTLPKALKMLFETVL